MNMPVKVLFWRVRNMKSVLRLIASLRLTTVGMVMLGVGGFVVSKRNNREFVVSRLTAAVAGDESAGSAYHKSDF